MTESSDARCPGCGTAVSSRYCPDCGARTGWSDLLPPVAASGQGASGTPVPAAPVRRIPLEKSPGVPLDEAERVPIVAPVRPDATIRVEPDETLAVDPPTVPSMPAVVRPAPTGAVPARAVPEMFSTQFLPVAGPAQAWSQTADPAAPTAAPPTGLFPGWTGIYPAVATDGAVGVLAPRPERRRRAIYAVLGIALATVAVLLVALVIAPKWGGTGGSGGTADKIGQGPVVSSAATVSPTRSRPSAVGSSTGSGSPAVVPPVSTVTVTAPTRTAAPGRGQPTKTAAPRTTARPKPTSTPKTIAPVRPLGVEQRDINCSAGFIVQLASELDQARFKSRVAALKAAGQLPAGALAADSTRSCRIFTSQVNTVVLYAGPFASKYDGCAARLAGPADAYIKGGNADTAREYISCLCPWSTARLPQYSTVGQQGVWVGELQRALGNRLNIEVSDLAGNWGKFTQGTQAAVRAFQQSKGLPSNGIVDARTWSALQSAQC